MLVSDGFLYIYRFKIIYYLGIVVFLLIGLNVEESHPWLMFVITKSFKADRC